MKLALISLMAVISGCSLSMDTKTLIGSHVIITRGPYAGCSGTILNIEPGTGSPYYTIKFSCGNGIKDTARFGSWDISTKN
jgi:hypothetical protein